MSCFLGIDAGTSGVKAVVMDASGALLGKGYGECDLITPRPSWVEQDPQAWWEACDAAVRQAVAKSGRGGEVAGIGFSGQMQGLTLMDKEMKPIGNCMIWLDQRASAEAEELNRRIDPAEALEITANHCLPSYWAAKLLWLRKNRPEVVPAFHVPFYPVTPVIAIILSIFMVTRMDGKAILIGTAWIIIGFIVYCLFHKTGLKRFCVIKKEEG